MKNISIVIPVYNEEYFIKGTLESISRIDYPQENYEVVVVSDGCTDDTTSVIRQFPFVRLVELKNNVGRFAARKIGAEAARNPNILYVDSRTNIDPNILSVINQSNAKVIVGTVLGAEDPGMFEIFYRSVRRKVFPKYYAEAPRQIELTKDNFDYYPKGTAVLFLEKDLLFQAYDDLSHVDMSGDSSDDTKLLNTIVQRTPAIIHPDVKIVYFYRKSFLANLAHLFGFNATSFVDYYLSPSQRYFWIVIVLPMIVLLLMLLGLYLIPIAVLTKITILMSIDIVLAIYFSKSFREFFIIIIMLPLCVSTFYLGILRGIYLKLNKNQSL